jgi:hypothetical protein
MKYKLIKGRGYTTFKEGEVYDTREYGHLQLTVQTYPWDWELVSDVTLPEKWFCIATEENIDMLNEWMKDMCSSLFKSHDIMIGYSALSKHIWDDSYYYGSTKLPEWEGYQEISSELFEELVYKPKYGKSFTKKTKSMEILTPITQVIKIHAIACTEWKSKIAKYLTRVDENQNIKFSQSEIDSMFGAATSPQLTLLEEIFGKQSPIIDYDKIKTGSKVYIKYTGQHCHGIKGIDVTQPVDVIFYKTPHLINSKGEFALTGYNDSYITFIQKGRFVLFSAHATIDYITKVISY